MAKYFSPKILLWFFSLNIQLCSFPLTFCFLNWVFGGSFSFCLWSKLKHIIANIKNIGKKGGRREVLYPWNCIFELCGISVLKIQKQKKRDKTKQTKQRFVQPSLQECSLFLSEVFCPRLGWSFSPWETNKTVTATSCDCVGAKSVGRSEKNTNLFFSNRSPCSDNF